MQMRVNDIHHVVGFVLAAEQGRVAAFDVVARLGGAVWVGAHLVLDIHHVVGFVLAAEQGRFAAFDVVARMVLCAVKIACKTY